MYAFSIGQQTQHLRRQTTLTRRRVHHPYHHYPSQTTQTRLRRNRCRHPHLHPHLFQLLLSQMMMIGQRMVKLWTFPIQFPCPRSPFQTNHHRRLHLSLLEVPALPLLNLLVLFFRFINDTSSDPPSINNTYLQHHTGLMPFACSKTTRDEHTSSSMSHINLPITFILYPRATVSPHPPMTTYNPRLSLHNRGSTLPSSKIKRLL